VVVAAVKCMKPDKKLLFAVVYVLLAIVDDLFFCEGPFDYSVADISS
jgi:hypothetical protein